MAMMLVNKFCWQVLFVLLACLGVFAGTALGQKKGAPTTPKAAIKKAKALTLRGAFTSTAGVMTTLSCYCGNGGTITTTAGKEIEVCFENAHAEITCTNIRVRGYYITKTNAPSPSSPCPQGTKTYFKVLTHTCL
jgi:hypothetical protein